MEALQSDVVGQLVLVFMENQTTWTGRVCDLLAYLTELEKAMESISGQKNSLPSRMD